MASFEVETEERSGDLVVRLIGEFDILAFDEVDALLAAAQSDGYGSVIVDLRGLTFIDSSGIRALVRAHKRTQDSETDLRLIRGSDAVHRVFEVAGLDGRLSFEEGASSH